MCCGSSYETGAPPLTHSLTAAPLTETVPHTRDQITAETRFSTWKQVLVNNNDTDVTTKTSLSRCCWCPKLQKCRFQTCSSIFFNARLDIVGSSSFPHDRPLRVGCAQQSMSFWGQSLPGCSGERRLSVGGRHEGHK